MKVFRPIPAESLKLLVFDLDGTLIDSAKDLSNSVNATLQHFGREALPDELVSGFVGNGVPLLLRRSLAYPIGIKPEEVDDGLLAEVQPYFLDYYRAHKLDFTYAYKGVRESLEAIRNLKNGSSRTMAILTNKPVRPSKGICEGLGMAEYFAHIYGGDSLPVKKPDPMGLNLLMKEAGTRPEETVMVGDSKVDVQTARNAGVWSLGCAFGFGPQNIMENPPDVLVDDASDWMAVLCPENFMRA